MHKHTVEVILLFGIGRAVFHAEAGELAAVAVNGCGLRVGVDVEVGERLGLFDQHVVGTEGVGKLKHGDVGADAGEVDGRLHTRVAAADDRHLATLVEGAVAVLAEVDAVADVGVFVLQIEPPPFGTGSDDDRRRNEGFTPFGRDALFLAFEAHAADAAVGKHRDGIGLQVAEEVGRKLATGGLRHRNEVFNTLRFVHLTTDALRHDGHVETFACGVDRSRSSGRAAAHDHHVKAMLHGFGLGQFVAAGLFFQFVEQHTEVAAADVDLLIAKEHRRHALEFESIHLVLEKSAVHHLVTNAGIDQRHDIERLHHIGTVRAGERHVGAEVERGFEGGDAAAERGIGEVLTLSVGIEHGEQERGKLMAVGDAAEVDAGRLAFAQHTESEGGISFGADVETQLFGAAHQVVEKLGEFSLAAMVSVVREEERNAGFQRGKHRFYLLQNIFVKHNVLRLRGNRKRKRRDRSLAFFIVISMFRKGLELADEVDAGLEGFLALLPFCGANFAVVSGYKLSSLYLAHEFVGVTADAVVLDFSHLDLTFGIDEERAAIGHTFFFNVHAEAFSERAEGIGEHGVLNLLDAVGSVVPCLVNEVRVAAHGEHFHAHSLQFLVLFSEVYEFGGADEGEVGRIEEEERPFALDVFAAYGLKFAVVVGLYLKFGYLCIDDRLHISRIC